MADTSTRILRASLRGRLYRDIELPSTGPLEDLAAAIVGAFGLDLDHAFGFYGSLGHRYHDAEERHELFAAWAMPMRACGASGAPRWAPPSPSRTGRCSSCSTTVTGGGSRSSPSGSAAWSRRPPTPGSWSGSARRRHS